MRAHATENVNILIAQLEVLRRKLQMETKMDPNNIETYAVPANVYNREMKTAQVMFTSLIASIEPGYKAIQEYMKLKTNLKNTEILIQAQRKHNRLNNQDITELSSSSSSAGKTLEEDNEDN